MDALKQAIGELGIDVPIYRIERLAGGGVTLHLRSGPVQWLPDASGRADAPSQFSEELREDLTAIPGVGKAAAEKLQAAGLGAFDELRVAEYARLVDVVGARTAGKIMDYFSDIPFP